MFPYRLCTEWLRDQVKQLDALVYKVEIVDNEAQLPTFMLKISSDSFLADLVVWQYGRSSMQIFALDQKRFILERHDVELSIDDFPKEMQIFFDSLKIGV
jgi:streptomycin 6-kinase